MNSVPSGQPVRFEVTVTALRKLFIRDGDDIDSDPGSWCIQDKRGADKEVAREEIGS